MGPTDQIRAVRPGQDHIASTLTVQEPFVVVRYVR